MICTNDTPVTDAELEAFYGKPVTESEILCAIERHARAFDADDLAEVVAEQEDSILQDLRNGFAWSIGDRIKEARRETIARRVSIELYGKPDVIKAWEVKV